MKRTFAISLGLAGLMTCASTAVATSADAASTGWICTAWRVPSIPAGTVCINAESNGYDAMYTNDSSSSHLVDFNLVPVGGKNIGDQGAFWASPGSSHTYFFATGNVGCAQVFVYARQEGWNIFSNPESTTRRC